MAGIGTVTSAGKVVLGLLDIDNQIKSGNKLGARSSADWLRNEISKMKLGEANKKITKLNSDLAKAISEEQTAKEKLATAKFDHLKAQTEQDVEHNKALADAELEDIKAQATQQNKHNKALYDQQVDHLKTETNTRMEAWKDRYDNREKDAQNAQRASEIKRIQEKVAAGEELLPYEQEFIRRAIPKSSGMDEEAFAAGVEDNENDTLLDSWMLPLQTKKQNGTITPQEDMRLYIMRMTRIGQADKIDPTVISRMFDETITEAQLEKMKQQAEYARKQRKSITGSQTAAPMTNGQGAGGYAPGSKEEWMYKQITGGQTSPPAETAPTPGSTLTPEQEAEIAAWKSVENEVVQDARDLEMNRTPAGRNVYNKRQEAAQSQREAAQNVYKNLPEGLAAVEYFRQQTAANPTDANKKLLNQVVDNFINAPYLSSDYASAVSFLENKVKQAGSEQDKSFWKGVLAQVSKEGVPKQSASAAKGTSSSSKKAGSSLNKYDAEVGTWRESKDKGQHKTGTPQEARSTYNANSVIASLGQTLPKSFTQHKGMWVDKDIGGIDWNNTKDAPKMLQFTSKFLNQLTTDLRMKGYTPADVQKIIEDIEGGVGVYGVGGGRAIDTKSTTGVDPLFFTFANIMSNPATKRILNDFKKHLATYAKQQGVKEEMMADATLSDEERRMGLWKGADGNDFDAWASGLMGGTKTTQTPTTQTSTGPQAGKKYRVFINKEEGFRDMDVERLVKDEKGNVTHAIVGGKRIKPTERWVAADQNVPIPQGFKLPVGTEVIYNGEKLRVSKHETFQGKAGGVVRYKGQPVTEYTDQDGNIRKVPRNAQLYFPSTLSTQQINRLLKGVADTSSGARRMLESGRKKPANPYTPNLTQPSNGAQKKNKGPVNETSGSTAASMTWETLKGGGRVVRLDKQGRSFASVLNLRKAGQRGRGLSGFYDADTGYGINVELPDWNKDGMPDDTLHLEGGATVKLPDIWKSEQYEKGEGAVYSQNTAIRLAGFQAQEIYLTEEDRTSGKMNPAAVRAQEALIQIFQQGWIDPSDKNRFIFKVRIVGTPNNHSAKYANPYRDKYDRIVTDVYIATGGVDKKIGEITWVNPTAQLQRKGHGRAWNFR